MKADDPAVLDVMRRSMVARIATLSRNGRPSINPLYFVYLNGHIWLGTVDWTLAARNVKADPRVSVLFEVEQDPSDQRVLRIRGRASVRTDQKAQRSYNLRTARKYLLTPVNYTIRCRTFGTTPYRIFELFSLEICHLQQRTGEKVRHRIISFTSHGPYLARRHTTHSTGTFRT